MKRRHPLCAVTSVTLPALIGARVSRHASGARDMARFVTLCHACHAGRQPIEYVSFYP